LSVQESWRVYASDHPRVDSLGSSITLTGLQMFLSINQLLVRSGEGVVTTPPSDVAGWDPVVTDVAADASAGTVTLTNIDQGLLQGLVMEATRPVSNGVQFASDYRHIQSNVGVLTPGTIAAGTNYVAVWGAITGSAGKVIFTRFRPFATLGQQFPYYQFRTVIAA
jgi:hypothetical protein